MRALDIFCGAGGSSAGAAAAGAIVVGGVDLDEVAIKTFANNFPDAVAVQGRLEQIDRRALRRQVGKVDLLLASPECTNHTCAKGSAPRSEDSRATAMMAVTYAREFSPEWVVLENVIHMRPWSRYGELKNEFLELGYSHQELVLEASDFGVPQKRKRLFLVCRKGQQPQLSLRKRPGRKPTIAAVLDPKGKWPTNLLHSPTRARATLDRAGRAEKSIGPNREYLIVYYGTDGCGGWQTLDRPLRTITTVDRFALVSPSIDGKVIRMLQVPELRRAMGFPDEFKLDHGTRRDKIRLLGNAVCPPVMQSIVTEIMKKEKTSRDRKLFSLNIQDAGSRDVSRNATDELHEKRFA
ncbi:MULTISPECIES: DNA cytosine methyltransferase [Hyphobacterium]|uniref:DNA (cytosine-5-)-methyltransferase n=1 Tax=Hyphobacterium vulgare TaxID=1736751 RepID=A0ABV6ZWL5_9PROT